MSSSSPTSTLNVDVRPGKPPMLRVDATDDAPRWAAEHRDALRAAVVQHGSLLVRGLGLRDVAGTEAVFRRLGSLMTEREAFAPRRTYSHGVYSASKWPPNQHMCMHHELSYALEFPSLMLFACLIAPTGSAAAPSCITRSPGSSAGSTKSHSSTSGRWTRRCASTSWTSTARTGCRSILALATATRSARTSCSCSTRSMRQTPHASDGRL